MTVLNRPGYSHTARSGTSLSNFIKNELNGNGLQTQTLNNVVIGGTTPAKASVTFLDESCATGLTAVGTNKATSLALTKAVNNITSAASGTGVTLPAVSTVGVGGSVIVFNNGANPIKVYGGASDTIDGVAAGTGVTLTNALRCRFIAVAAATWLSAQLGAVSA